MRPAFEKISFEEESVWIKKKKKIPYDPKKTYTRLNQPRKAFITKFIF